MSNRALRWAFHLQLKGAAKAVLLALADCLNDTTNRCDPSNATLALYAGVDERTVRRACLDLQVAGLLKIRPRAGTSSQHTLSVGMRLATPDTTPGVKEPKPRTPRPPPKRPTPDTTPAHPGRDARPTPDTTSATPDTTPPKPLEPSIEPPLNPQSFVQQQSEGLFGSADLTPPISGRGKGGQDTPQFQAFWQCYPRKDGKGSARKAWDKATRKATAETIMAGLSRYPFSDEAQYRPMPSTWLNDERWSSEATTISAPQGSALQHRKGGGAAAMLDEIYAPFMTERGDND